MRLMLVACVCVSVAAACDDDGGGSGSLPAGTPTEAQVASTPRADHVAERLALRCTDDVVADEARYLTIAADLGSIEAVRGSRPTDVVADQEQTSVRFDLPMTEDRALLAGGDAAFDALTERLGGETRYNEAHAAQLGDALLWVDFGDARYDFQRTWLLYGEVLGLDPSLAMGERGGIFYDGSYVYFDLASSPRRYLVAVGVGDCPAGCQGRMNELWEIDGDGVATKTAEWQNGVFIENTDPPEGFTLDGFCAPPQR